MSSVNVAELRSGLVKAKHLIQSPDSWLQGGLLRDNKMCALGALCCAVPESDVEGYISAKNALREALPAGEISVPTFNDKPTTTHADVLALFDRAISALDIQEFLSIANEAEKPLVNLTDALNLAWLVYPGDGE